MTFVLPYSALAGHNENPAPLENVLIEGVQNKLALENELAHTPGGITLVDTVAMDERHVANLADMLRYVPGVWVASGSTGDSTFISSRGSNLDATSYDGNGIKFLQDGLPVTAADGNNHNRNIDPLSTRYAVVARGANALTYGASTLGGAIDFISPTARDTEPQILLNGGSHSELQGRATAGAITRQFDGLVTIEARSYQGFRNQQQQQERLGFYANTGWQFSDAVHTRFYATYLDNDQELPGALTAEQFAEDPYQAEAAAVTGNYQYNVESWRLANKTVWEDSDSSLTLGISFEEQALHHPIVYSPFFSLLIDTDQNNLGTSLRYNLRLGNHDLLAGVNYGETTAKGGNYSHEAGIRDNLMTLVDNTADSLEVFIVDRWQIAAHWNLIYGVQAVSASREVRNASEDELYNPEGDYDSINPRMGVIYQLAPNSELFANLSRLFEAPTNYELEDDADPSPDTQPLDAMQGTVFEFGTRGDKQLGGINLMHWELALYYAKLQDEILSVDDPAAPGTSLSSNVDDTIHAGIEALVGASFGLDAKHNHRLEPILNLTINEFIFANDPVYGNNQLPAAPGYAIKAEIIYRHANGFFLGPTFDFVDERYVDFSNTYSVDAYTLLGLRTGFASGKWEVYGDARNLTDEEYVGVFSVKDEFNTEDAIFQPGAPRSVYLGMKFQF